MTYKEVKEIITNKIQLAAGLFPNIAIDFNALFGDIMCELERLMDDEELQEAKKGFVDAIMSIASASKRLLIMENISQDEMLFLKALNYLIWNWAKARNAKEVIDICEQNDVLIETQYSLKNNLAIMRHLITEAEKIIAFRPKDIEFSGMYLDRIDRYFEIIKKKGLDEYGKLRPEALKEFEKEA